MIEKPKEFWIDLSDFRGFADDEGDRNFETQLFKEDPWPGYEPTYSFHYIEYSAYEAEKKRADELEAAVIYYETHWVRP